MKLPSRILIDLDGTLANNIPTLLAAYKLFLSRFKHVGTEKEFYDLVGPPIAKAVEILKERYKIDHPLPDLVRMYEESIQEGYRCSYELHTDADTFLEWAHRNGVPMTLATAAPKRLAMEFIRRYDLERFFEKIVTADDTYLMKTDPQYFHQITEDPTNTLMIDDSPAVIAAARHAGLRTHLFKSDWKALLDQFSIHFAELPLKPNFRIEVAGSQNKKPYSKKTQERIDEIWAEACAKQPDTLFNGQILNYMGANAQQLTGEFVEYKAYMAQMICPELKAELNIRPVGVTVFVTDQKHVLIGKRSDQVATHQHLYELVPSGGVDAAFFHSGLVDGEKLVLHELKEETGLNPAIVETLRATHLVRDPATGFYEICYIMTINATQNVVSKGEHTELLWLPFDKVKEFVKENAFVPLSEYVIKRIVL